MARSEGSPMGERARSERSGTREGGRSVRKHGSAGCAQERLNRLARPAVVVGCEAGYGGCGQGHGSAMWCTDFGALHIWE